MNISPDIIQLEVDLLYKSHYGKMVALLFNSYPDISLGTVEDLVQDSFTAALTAWAKGGVPSNPAGWIFTVCRNRAINIFRKAGRTRPLAAHDQPHAPAVDIPESAFDDQQLRLLFACAHPDLPPKTQVVITLKYVINLKVEAIAAALGMTVDGISKLLLRARQKIRDEKILLAEPDPSLLKSRLSIVHKIIYLIFNEGYKTSSGKKLLKEELCEEALLICKSLLDARIGDKTTVALHALMLLNAARFKTRFGALGELLDLEEQDRSLWNKGLVLLAGDLMMQSRGPEISTYHYEAAIAWLHCMAKTFQATDWNAICKLYRQLLLLYPNPFVELNYSIALYYAGQKKVSLQLLQDLSQHPFLSQYYLLNAALGKIHLLEGDLLTAREYYVKALGQTDSAIEKEFIQKMIARTIPSS